MVLKGAKNSFDKQWTIGGTENTVMAAAFGMHGTNKL